MKLKGKVALVTGSSRGIGKAIARDLAANGAVLVVHGSRESEALDGSLDDVKKLAPGSIKAPADLADADAIGTMFDTIRESLGRLDILVNNAAMQLSCPLIDIKLEDWDHVLAVNLRAGFICTQHAARMMRDQGGGKIINISSVHEYHAKRNFAHYSTSKGGLATLTKIGALELAQYNIQVNSLAVGAIDTEMTPANRQDKLTSAIPAARIGRPEEVAQLVTYLCTEAADYITGESVAIDGGLLLGFCASRPDL